jgi:probable HAF family extracellular repeat protein
MLRRATNRNFLLLALLVFSIAAWGQTYTVTDLGTLRPGSARVHAVNASGQVAGSSGHPHGADTHAFFWQKTGGIRDLGTLPGGDYSAAFDINDSGVVVGSSNTSTTVHAFTWTAAKGLQDLGTLPGTNSSSAFAINNQGEIAGASGVHAALWSGGTIHDLGTLGGATSESLDLNNVGMVVGVSDTAAGPRAFLWKDGAMQDLGVLPGDASSRADHINDTGTVVGASEGAGGTRAFVWTSADGMQALDSSGSTYSEAFSVNNLDQIVGQSSGSLGMRAFFWSKQSGLVDLNDVVTNLPGDVVLIGAFSINDKGQIVAFGLKNPLVSKHHEVNADSHVHAGPTRVFLLTPQ